MSYSIFVLGTGDFARCAIDGVVASHHKLSGVLTWEARGKLNIQQSLKRLLVPDLSRHIENLGIKQPAIRSANSPEFIAHLKALAPDILLVSGWGEILNSQVLAIPRVAAINIHPSLLPKHRGSNPFASVLRAGESLTGVTFHLLTGEIDGGDILFQSQLPIYDSDDYHTLGKKLAYRSQETLALALERVGQQGQAQNASEASYFPKLKPVDYLIDWHLPAVEIRARLRSAGGHVTRHGGRLWEVGKADILDSYLPHTTPGQVVHKFGAQLLVSTGSPNRLIWIQSLRQPGRWGALKGKVYALKQIQVGDLLGDRGS